MQASPSRIASCLILLMILISVLYDTRTTFSSKLSLLFMIYLGYNRLIALPRHQYLYVELVGFLRINEHIPNQSTNSSWLSKIFIFLANIIFREVYRFSNVSFWLTSLSTLMIPSDRLLILLSWAFIFIWNNFQTYYIIIFMFGLRLPTV